jgi:hypothetical protein
LHKELRRHLAGAVVVVVVVVGHSKAQGKDCRLTSLRRWLVVVVVVVRGQAVVLRP